MNSKEEYIALIQKRLSPYRFNHSMCVAKKAKELAQKHGLDGDKAYIAGILHDVTKEEDYDIQRELIEREEKMTPLEINNKKVYHQMSGASFVKNVLGIEDEDIIGGIRYHTTGRENMTLFEMIIYLADFTSDDRDYPDVDIMRKKTDENLLDGMLYSLSYTITSIVKQGRQIHPDTINCYNYCLALSVKH
ncbi:MAG: bis(5'-nucleosyl)-tetraphosphatase (symmetrical) YqeK [Eubacterium sp.]|nr:bis(5'-nucleosyl)-tetraphosphatase (symmetrical) YqeK [Eubacterium sp.]